MTILFLLGVLGTTWKLVWANRTAEAYSGPLWTASKEKLVLSIVERGALESAENSDIVCRVKASGRGSTVSAIIKWLIDDGTQVVRGQKLIELDDSGLQEQLKDQLNKVNQARAAWVQAEQNYLIVESQNYSDIESAKTALVLAEIELKKFLGDRIAPRALVLNSRDELQRFLDKDLEPLYRQELSAAEKRGSVSDVLQTLNDIEGRIEIARSDREMWLDRASWSSRMVKKGYLTRSQSDSDKARLDSADFTLKKTQNELDIFRKYTVDQKVTELWSKIKEAERALDRVKSQSKSKQVQAQADRESKLGLYNQEEGKRVDIEEEIRHCVVYSPQDGMVVYFMPESSSFSRGGSSSQQGIIAQGEPVREGQKLMRIPNLSRMLVSARVHEAMVSRVKGEVLRPTGFSDSLQASFSLARTPLDLAVNAAVFHANHRDQFRERDYVTLYSGQQAFVRVDAYPSKVYKGHVKSVATVASQADFMSSDVKVYQTMVAIDGLVEYLKPGMSAEVTIVADETTEPVLTVPIQSVLGSLAMGAKRKIYRIDANGQPVLHDVTVGRSNDKMVEILAGIEEGDKVVLNPRSLLGDKSELRPGSPGQRRGVDVESVKSKKGSGKKTGSAPPSEPMPPGANELKKSLERSEAAPAIPTKKALSAP